MSFRITTQRYKEDIYTETFFMTHNDLLHTKTKPSTTETKSYQSKGYQNCFMQINCRLNLSLLSVQG